MVKAAFCSPSDSPWVSPMHVVPKKDGSWRTVSDLWRLPTPKRCYTILDRYSVTHLHDFSSNVQGKPVFSKLDLYRAYHQMPVAREDIANTALIIPFGLYEFKVITFGLRNAGQYIHSDIFTARDRPLRFCFRIHRRHPRH